MSVHRYSSWGRTRRPKNITTQDRAYLTGSRALHDLNKFTTTGGFTESVEGNDAFRRHGMYETQNQRYCHVITSGSATITNMYVYNHAAGFWGEMLTGSTNDGPVCLLQATSEYRKIDISGVDIVAFKSGSAGKISVSFSTF